MLTRIYFINLLNLLLIVPGLACDGSSLTEKEPIDSACIQSNTALEKSLGMANSLLYSHKFDSCIIICKSVLQEYPGCKIFIDVLINASAWSQNHNLCLEYCNYGLEYYPQNKEYQFSKAKSLYFLGKYSESGQILEGLLKAGYYNTEFEWLVPEIRKLNNKNIQFTAATYYYRKSKSVWNYNSLGLGFRIGKIFFVPRVNVSQMIDKTNDFGEKLFYQYELQLFPKLKHGFYPFVNYGYSASIMQPEHKAIIEVYKSLKKSSSLSAGFYYFKFHDNKDLFTLSASVGKYFGKYEFVLKPYFTFNDGDFNQSYSVISKKILDKYDNFFSITWRIGKTPFNPYYLIEDNNKFISINDFRVYGEFQHTLKNKILLKIALGGGKDIYSNESDMKYFESNITAIIYL